MSTSHHDTVHRLFTEAVRLPPEERSAYIEEACADDAGLRAEVEAMLAEDARADGAFAAVADEGGARFLAGAFARDGDLEAPAREQPERLGKYRILRRIGEGGMGVVYEAEQDDPRRLVALKVIRTSMVTRDLLQRFRHEARVLGHLRHPGIAQIYEAGTADTGAGGQPYFAMELVEGQIITDYADANGLDTRARLDLLAQLCDILEYAHQKGVIHRDIKPANILVTAELTGTGSSHGQPLLKVLDFGVARATDADLNTVTLQTTMGQLIGTVPYMSPEQASGDPAQIDTRSDVYSVGVLGWELLTGRLPYDVRGKMVHEAVRVIREQEPSRLSAVDRSFRGDIETIFAKALAKDKERRYQSAADLAADLRHYLAHEPIAARPASTLYQLGKFARRNKTLVGGVAATLVVAIVGAVIATSFAIAATQRANELERTSYIAGLAAAVSSLEQDEFIAASGYLDKLPESLRGWEYDYLRARLEHHLDEWETPAQVMTPLVFDRAGRRAFAVMADKTLGTWNVSDGRLLQTRPLDMHRVAITQAVIHGPTERMAVVSAGGDIVIGTLDGDEEARFESGGDVRSVAVHDWDAAGERLLWSRVPDEDPSNDVLIWDGTRSRVLGDGRWLHGCTDAVFNHAGDRIAITGAWGWLWIVDAATGRILERTRTDDVAVYLAFAPDDETLAVAFTSHDACLFDGRTLELKERMVGHRDLVYGVAWTASGMLVTASKDGTVRMRDPRGRSIVRVVTLEPDRRPAREVISVSDGYDLLASVTPDGEHVVVASDRILRFAIDDPHVLRGHATYVYHLAFSPDGSMLASTGWTEPEVHVWDVHRARPRWRLRAPRTGSRSWHLEWQGAPFVAFSDDGQRLVVGTTEETLQYDVRSGVELASSVLDDPGDRFLATLDARRPMRLTSPSVAISPDGRRVALCQEDGTVLLFDAIRSLDDWKPEQPSVVAKHVMPELDGWIAPEPTAVLEGHVNHAYCAAFSPDGTRIATGGKDTTIRIWDARTHEQLLVLRGHDEYVKDIVFSPDGTLLASASGDRTIRLWDTLPLHERRAMARRTDGASD